MTSESWWLIERPGEPGRPLYWMKAGGWTDDPWAATRYSRKADAERALHKWLVHPTILDARAVEHGFEGSDAHVHDWKRVGCMGARDERCHPEPGMCACFDGAWECPCGEKTRTNPSAFVPDLDRSFVTVMVPTAPRTTISSSPPDPAHVSMVVSLSELAAWLSKEDDRG